MPDDRHPARFRRHLATRFVALTLGFAAASVPAIAAAASISGQQERLRQLEADISVQDARFATADGAFRAAQSRLATVNTRIAANIKALKEATEEHAAAQATLKNRLSAIYRQPQPTSLEVLLRSRSVSAAMAQFDFVQRVQSRDANVVQVIARNRVRIAKARAELDRDKKAAAADVAESKARRQEIAAIRAARLKVLLGARAQLAAMVAAEQNAERLRALRGAQRRVNGQITTNNGGAPRGGGPAPVVGPAPVAAPAPRPPSGGGGGGDLSATLQRIAQCESGGNPAAVSPSGTYRGKYQFDVQTWQSMGGSGDPAKASEAEQDQRAAQLYRQRGAAPWPVCGR